MSKFYRKSKQLFVPFLMLFQIKKKEDLDYLTNYGIWSKTVFFWISYSQIFLILIHCELADQIKSLYA